METSRTNSKLLHDLRCVDDNPLYRSISMRVNAKQDIINAFSRCHCLNPNKVRSVDHFSGKLVVNYFPCGHCSHCLNSKANDLSTRIELDSRVINNGSVGFSYFLTLTYTSVYYKNGKYYGKIDKGTRRFPKWVDYELSPRAFKVLSDNMLHFDNINQNKRFCWSTCLLNLDDFSGFMKRLRKAFPGVIFQYVCCGEYGHKFGRPHMHVLLNSSASISNKDFQNAWSLYGCPLGSCYVEDLYKNGTMNGIREFSVGRCVSYVTKYALKGNSNINTTRLEFARQLYSFEQPFYSDKYIYTHPTWINYINEFNYYLFYDKDNYGFDCKSEKTLQQIKLHEANTGASFISKVFISDIKQFACRPPRYSIRHCFGSLYLSANIERFIAGDKTIPTISNNSSVFPLYFSRKIRERKCPIGFYKTHPSGCHSFSKGCFPFVVRSFKVLRSFMVSHDNFTTNSVLYKNFSPFDPLCFLSNPKNHIYRFDTKEHLYFYCNGFYGFSYDRRKRKYIQNGTFYSVGDLFNEYILQENSLYQEQLPILFEKDCQKQFYDLMFSNEYIDLFNIAINLELLNWERVHNGTLHRIKQDSTNYL